MAPPGLGLDVAQARAKIEERLEAHDQELVALAERYQREHDRIAELGRQLRSEINSIAPIAHLPPELMSKIFEEYVADHWRAIDCYKIFNHYEWLVILHVCRGWRRLALDTPGVWTSIPPLRPEYVELALSRSRNCPLTMLSSPISSESHLTTFYRAIIRELPRIRVADFYVTDELQALFSSDPAANLDETSLISKELSLQLGLDVGVTSPILPALSLAKMPLLTSLNVGHASLGLITALIRPTLTVLNVWFSTPVSAVELISLIRELPLLRRLELSRVQALSVPSSTDALASCTVPLRHLKFSCLLGDPPSMGMAQLLDCLVFPMDAEICYYAHKSTFAESMLVLPLVVSKAIISTSPTPNESVTKFRPYSISFMSPIGMEVQVLGAPASGAHQMRLRMCLESCTDGSAIQIFELFDLTEMRYMDISIKMESETWIRLFRDKPLLKVNKLRLSEYAYPEDWLDILSTPLYSTSSSTPFIPSGKRYLFPNLKILDLKDQTFRAKHDEVHKDDMLPRIIQRLLEFCRLRGYPLDELHITQPINLVTETDLATLKDPRIAKSFKIEDASVQDWRQPVWRGW
ncbi:hypothetical protein NM688_g1832 [Phlebia brevispora]|uniref:Uncharacterized protein n=1 Tax=Phlebia brevispora TaxID=194682 RepID=A0ACC1TAE7_9APHY|nr:hypothetical protein NM688_g1832 [Phlebia brevispora]